MPKIRISAINLDSYRNDIVFIETQTRKIKTFFLHKIFIYLFKKNFFSLLVDRFGIEIPENYKKSIVCVCVL